MNDELDLELEDSEAELLGTYPSIEDYFLSQLEDLLRPEGMWLLDCLHMPAIRLKLEDAGSRGRYRYFMHKGNVYRELVSEGR